MASALFVLGVLCPHSVPAADATAPRGQDSGPRLSPSTDKASFRGLRFFDDRAGTAARAAPAQPQRRFAVCVGIDGYQDGSGYSPLQFAGQDAVGVAESLLENCQFEKVLLLTDAKADALDALTRKYPAPRLKTVREVSRNAIRDRSEEFLTQANSPDDVVLFYFAGHGDANPHPCLIAGDYRRDDARACRNLLPLYDVFHWATSTSARGQNRVFIFDACRVSPTGEDGQVLVPGFYSALTVPGDEMTILSGCNANQCAHEDASLRHGRFSWTLIQALRGEAYKPNEGRLLLDHVFEYIEQSFQQNEAWSRQQTPRKFSSGGGSVAISCRKVAPPKKINASSLKRLEEFRINGREQYRRNELESAYQDYSQCLWGLDLLSEKDEQLQRLWVEALSEHSCLLYRLSQEEDSSRLAEQAAKLPPEDPILRLALREREGYLRMKDGEFAEAKEAFDAVIAGSNEANPIAPFVWSQRGTSLRWLKQYAEATDSFGQAATLYVQLGCLEDAAADLEQAASCCEQQRDFEKAYQWIRKANELLKQVPRDKKPLQRANLLHRMSVLLGSMERLPEGESIAQEALALRTELLVLNHPHRARTLGILAKFHRANSEYGTAERLYEEAVAILKSSLGDHPLTEKMATNLAVLYGTNDNYEKLSQLYPQHNKPVQHLSTSLTKVAASVKSRSQLDARFGLDDGGICVVGRKLLPYEVSRLEREFEPGVDYMVVAAGDEDASLVSLRIVADENGVCTADEGSSAIVRFTPSRSGTCRVELQLSQSPRNAYCSFVILRRGSLSLPLSSLVKATSRYQAVSQAFAAGASMVSVELDFLPGRTPLWGCVVRGGESRVMQKLKLGSRPSVMLAVGDDSSVDWDLSIADDRGVRVALDDELDSMSVVAFQPLQDRSYDVRLTNSSREGAASFALFGAVQLDK